MNVEREIAIYERTGEKLVKTISLPLTEDELAKIFIAQDDDPDFYKIYPISGPQYHQLKFTFPELGEYSLENFELFMECFEIK